MDDVKSQLERAFYRAAFPKRGVVMNDPFPCRDLAVKRSTARFVQDLVRNRFISYRAFSKQVILILVTS